MARAVVVNAAQLASYSQSKQFLLDSGEFRGEVRGEETPKPPQIFPLFDILGCPPPGHFRDDILCHFCASMISGLVTTAASMPVDIVKTR